MYPLSVKIATKKSELVFVPVAIVKFLLGELLICMDIVKTALRTFQMIPFCAKVATQSLKQIKLVNLQDTAQSARRKFFKVSARYAVSILKKLMNMAGAFSARLILNMNVRDATTMLHKTELTAQDVWSEGVNLSDPNFIL